jgi:hypothetical protein
MPWCRSVIRRPVVLGVELEQDLIEALGHVVDRAGPRRVQDLLALLARGRVDLHVEVALGDRARRPRNSRRRPWSRVDEVGVDARLDQRGQDVVRGAHVVVHRVDLVAVGLHRIGRGALLGEVDHRVGAVLGEPALQPLVLGGEVEEVEVELPPVSCSRCGSAPGSNPWG